MNWFNPENPQEAFRNLPADSAAALMAAAADIALIIDADGVVVDHFFVEDNLPNSSGYKTWRNKLWIDTVTVESRPKVEQLLKEAAAGQIPKWRQLNHPSTHGADLPVQYVTVPFDSDGRVLAIGRNVAQMAELQQQLLLAHQSMEKSHHLCRQLETRYKMLLQFTSDAVFIVDAASMQVLEANPAAEQLLDKTQGHVSGADFRSFFSDIDKDAVDHLLLETRIDGRRSQSRTVLTVQHKQCMLSAVLFSRSGSSLFLVLAKPQQESTVQPAAMNLNVNLLELMERAPDGFVVTSADGRVLSANSAFLELTQAGSMARVLNEMLDRWFGRTSVDLNILMANLQEHGTVRLFPTRLRNEYGVSTDVEISATRITTSEHDVCFGFVIRDTETRLATKSRNEQIYVSRPVDQLAKLVGRMPLKDLVQQSTKMVERYCIEAALEITGENRTSAAELLGLSRQSLYIKLRRYGLGDLE
ncbi:MAG: transcriptional regulator PpsR [Pseudohongiellaceae bacterium]